MIPVSHFCAKVFFLFSNETFINPQPSSTMAGCEQEYSIGYYTKTAWPCVPVGTARLYGAWLLRVKGGKSAVHAVWYHCAMHGWGGVLDWRTSLRIAAYLSSRLLCSAGVLSDTLSILPASRNPRSRQPLPAAVVGGKRSCGRVSIGRPRGVVEARTGSRANRPFRPDIFWVRSQDGGNLGACPPP